MVLISTIPFKIRHLWQLNVKILAYNRCLICKVPFPICSTDNWLLFSGKEFVQNVLGEPVQQYQNSSVKLHIFVIILWYNFHLKRVRASNIACTCLGSLGDGTTNRINLIYCFATQGAKATAAFASVIFADISHYCK
jgi:hypothetical protein